MSRSWVPFTRYLFNTAFITVAGTTGHLLIASMGAFVLAKYEFPGSKTFFKIVITALMFNGYVTAIPNYLVMSKIGWIDTVFAVVVPAFAAPMGLFLMKQYMEGIPDALIEAAKIDGAKEWRIYSRIVMPMVKPAWLTLMILSIQGLWNTRASNFIYSEQLKTLPYALQQIVNGGIARAGVGAAVALVMMIVPVTAFVVVESNIIETMASSGIKD
jgi:ABC-type glycerol-3-phosphate transport system permease component